MTRTVHSTTANGLRFGYLEAGSGPLALCLHGFPDTAYTWRHLLPVLADAGYHAVAPFMRGYAPTDVPEDGCYETAAIATDALALREIFAGDERAVLIGHDWGAFAAYGAAALEPKRWKSVIALSSPPTQAIIPSFLDYDQLRRSFYHFIFQTPVAEAVVGHDDFAFLDRLWSEWTVDYDAESDLANVKESLRAQANLRAAIGYYRGMFDVHPQPSRYSALRHRAASVPAKPVLYLQGDRDGALGPDLAENAKRVFTSGSVIELLEGVGHFPHLERPAAVHRHILDWIT